MKSKRFIGGYILLLVVSVAGLGTIDVSKRDTAIGSFVGGLFVGALVVLIEEDRKKND